MSPAPCATQYSKQPCASAWWAKSEQLYRSPLQSQLEPLAKIGASGMGAGCATGAGGSSVAVAVGCTTTVGVTLGVGGGSDGSAVAVPSNKRAAGVAVSITAGVLV